MSKAIRRFILLFLILSLVFSQVISVSAVSSDYSEHWAENIISKWISAGLVKGNPDGSIKPDSPVKRAEFLAFMNRVFNYVEKSNTVFTDVKAGAWYAEDVSKAESAGLILVDGNGATRPEDPITRQEAAVVIARAFELKAVDTRAADKFTDSSLFPSWSRDAICALTENGVVKGRPDKSFGYSSNITRAESISMINNAMGELLNKAGTYSGAYTGNLVVNTQDIILKNLTINGSLYLTPGLGDGNVTLDNVKVDGRTYIRGGGENSIIIINSKLAGTLHIMKKDGKIRIVAQGTTEIPDVKLNSGAVLVEDNATGKCFGDIEIVDIVSSGETIKLEGDFTNVEIMSGNINITLVSGSIGKLEVGKDAGNTNIDIGKEVVLTTLEINAAINVTGQGTITNAIINAAGVSIQQTPVTATVADGYSAVINGTQITGTVTASVTTGNIGNDDGNDGYTPPSTTSIKGTITVNAGYPDLTLANIQLKKNGSAEGSYVHPASNGDYTIAGVASGSYTIEVSLTGYIKATIPAFDATAGQTVNGKNIELAAVLSTVNGTISVNEGSPDLTQSIIQLKHGSSDVGTAVYASVYGTYAITGVAPGTYTVEAALTGYAATASSSFTVAGSEVTGIDIQLAKTVPTAAGELVFYPTQAVPSEVHSLEIYYSPGEDLTDGTIVLNLPDAFAATTNDKISLTTGGSYIYLEEEQISNSGKTVTLTDFDMFSWNNIMLKLIDKTIPDPGTYNFSATADADGDKDVKSPSAGTGTETRTITSAPGHVSDLKSIAGDGKIDFTFSRLTDATSVILEQSSDEIHYSESVSYAVYKDTGTATVYGLTNGVPYYFRLNVTDGYHDGISSQVYTAASLIDQTNTTVSVDTPLASGGTSTVTVAMKDSLGQPVTGQDAYKLSISADSSITFKINETEYSGQWSYKTILTAPANVNGISQFTVTLPALDPDSYFVIYIRSTSDYSLGNAIRYEGP